MTRTDDMLIERLRVADPLPHDELDRLLREGSVEDLLARAPVRRPERRSRRVLWGAATAAGVAAVAGVLVVSLPKGRDAPVAGHLSILDEPQEADDRIPAWALGDESTLPFGIDAASSRLAFTRNGRRYYVARASMLWSGPPQICLLDMPTTVPPLPRAARYSVPPARGGSVTCVVASVMSQRFLVSLRGGDGRAVAGVVPDGYDRVAAGSETVVVTSNVFVFDDRVAADPLTATGPAGRREAYLGIAAPPEPDVTPRGLSPVVSVFRRPAVTEDALPPRTATALEARHRRGLSHTGAFVPVVGSARYAGGGPGRRRWVLRDARRRDALVIASVGRDGRLLELAWGRLPTRAEPLPTATSGETREPFGPRFVSITAVVPDGFDTAVYAGRTFTLRANLLSIGPLQQPTSASLELLGQAGTLRRTVSSAFPSPTGVRIPTNDIPLGAANLLRSEAAANGVDRPDRATIVATYGALLPRVWRSPRPALQPTQTLVILTASQGRRTVWVLADRIRAKTPIAVRVFDSRPPDLTPLGRVRPLDLTP